METFFETFGIVVYFLVADGLVSFVDALKSGVSIEMGHVVEHVEYDTEGWSIFDYVGFCIFKEKCINQALFQVPEEVCVPPFWLPFHYFDVHKCQNRR